MCRCKASEVLWSEAYLQYAAATGDEDNAADACFPPPSYASWPAILLYAASFSFICSSAF